MRNALSTLTLTAALLAAGCSAADEPPASAPSAPAGTASAPPAATTSPSPAEPTPTASAKPTASPKPAEPVGACLGGRFVLVRFSGLSSAIDLAATGKDVTATFADGQYTLQAAGRSPYTVTDGKNKASLTVKGTMTGRYTAKDSGVRYSLTSAKGSGELAANGKSQRASMDEISKTLAPQGAAPTTCAGDRLTITNPQAKLEFRRA